MGGAEGRSPFAGSMRVPLRCNFFPLPGQACPEPAEGKGVRGMVERVFQHPVLDQHTGRPRKRGGSILVGMNVSSRTLT